MGAFESGRSLLDLFLAKLPEADRPAAKALFEKAEAKDAVTLIGDSALARSDYSSKMDLVKARQDELEAWFGDNKAALDEYVTIKPEYDKLKTTPPVTTTTGLDEKGARKVAEDLISEQGPAFIQASAWMAAKALEHHALFGEQLDILALASDPRLGKQIKGQPEGRVVSLPDLYQEKYGEKVATKAKEAEDKRINDLVDAKFKERVGRETPNPFPLRGESSVLDVLTEKDGAAAHNLDTATALYESLQAGRA